MKLSLMLVAVTCLALAALAAFAIRAAVQRPARHDPVEYYSRWSAFYEPVRLSRKITREQAGALAAKGYAYLTGHYDDDGRLVKAIKYMPDGEVFFAIAYAYRPDGRLQTATITAHGKTDVYSYDERGRRRLPLQAQN